MSLTGGVNSALDVMGGYVTPAKQQTIQGIGSYKPNLTTELDRVDFSGSKEIAKKSMGILARLQDAAKDAGGEALKKLFAKQQEALTYIEKLQAAERSDIIKKIREQAKDAQNLGKLSFENQKILSEFNTEAVKFAQWDQELVKAAKNAKGKPAGSSEKQALERARNEFHKAYEDLVKKIDGKLTSPGTGYNQLKTNIAQIKGMAKKLKIDLSDVESLAREQGAKAATKAAEKAGEEASKGLSEAAKKNWKIAGGVAAGVVGTWILCKLFGGSSQQAQQ